MFNKKLWHFIRDELSLSAPVVLLCVVDSEGSSPGRKGFMMAVSQKGLSGSIGGGMMEHKFVEMAKDRLKSFQREPLLKRQVHRKNISENQSGMICSGEQTIVMYTLTEKALQEISNIIAALEHNKHGMLTVTPGEFYFVEGGSTEQVSFTLNADGDWKYSEYIGFKNHLCIVGGGHCALALSRLFNGMDFFIHLYEERKDLNTIAENSFIHELNYVNDYSELKQSIYSGKNVYAVIMTFGYRTDNVAFRAIFDKEFAYLGVLGSQSKMDKLFEEWRVDGLDEEMLNRVHSPIGIKINSRTPEEIAVSIGAEIILVKNKN